MRTNVLSERLLSKRQLVGQVFTYAGVVDTVGYNGFGAYINGYASSDAGCSYTYGADCGCCGDDGYPNYNCYSCYFYQNAFTLPNNPSSSFSSNPTQGYTDSNKKGFKSLAVYDSGNGNGAATYYYNTCASCDSSANRVNYPVVYGYFSSAAFAGIKEADGTLWTWGYSGGLYLGDGGSTSRISPVQVGSDSWTMISAANGRFSAIRSDGTLWSWGSNNNGVLGVNDSFNRNSPTQISGGGTWKYVHCGMYHTTAIKTDDTLWCWGWNYYGQCGTNTYGNSYSSPVQVYGGGTWKRVKGGYLGTLAIKTNGTMWGFGYNYNYQVGPAFFNQQSSPVLIGGGYSDWVDMSLPYYYYWGYGIRSNGTLWAWGSNPYGVSSATYSNPVQVGSATNYASASVQHPYNTSYIGSAAGPSFITTSGNVVAFQGYNSTTTSIYSGGYATQLIGHMDNYQNAHLIKYVP